MALLFVTISASAPSITGTNRISVSVQNNTGYRLRYYDIRIRMNDGNIAEDHWYARNLIQNAQNINGFTTENFTTDFTFGYYYSTQGQQGTGTILGDELYKESPRSSEQYALDLNNRKYSLELRNSTRVEIELVIKYGYTDNIGSNYFWHRWITTLQITG